MDNTDGASRSRGRCGKASASRSSNHRQRLAAHQHHKLRGVLRSQPAGDAVAGALAARQLAGAGAVVARGLRAGGEHGGHAAAPSSGGSTGVCCTPAIASPPPAGMPPCTQCWLPQPPAPAATALRWRAPAPAPAPPPRLQRRAAAGPSRRRPACAALSLSPCARRAIGGRLARCKGRPGRGCPTNHQPPSVERLEASLTALTHRCRPVRQPARRGQHPCAPTTQSGKPQLAPGPRNQHLERPASDTGGWVVGNEGQGAARARERGASAERRAASAHSSAPPTHPQLLCTQRALQRSAHLLKGQRGSPEQRQREQRQPALHSLRLARRFEASRA